MKKVYLLSLGCPRNLVDSEALLAYLEEKSFILVEDPAEADIAIVNTCAFIQDAKEESINMILELAELKKKGSLKKLVIAGCLSQRYPRELKKQIKEIDAILGISNFWEIPYQSFNRKLLTPLHYAYVKIQEGCSNKCSYCVIPNLKGSRRSRTIDSILEEVASLKSKHNIKEVILIGQDTTSFGIDKEGKYLLPELLLKLDPIMQESWIRLLYTHPMHFTEELIDVISNAKNICKYIDLPIQHIDDKILERMDRHITKKEIVALIERIRKRIKNVAIRSSVIVGFPGESEAHFKKLLDFLEKVRFERLGAFIYSREEGTKAAQFKGQIPEKEKKARFDEVMHLQQRISQDNNLEFLNKRIRVLIDKKEDGQFIGRTEIDAPEVDGSVYIKSSRSFRIGDFVDVKITGTQEYDLVGEVL